MPKNRRVLCLDVGYVILLTKDNKTSRHEFAEVENNFVRLTVDEKVLPRLNYVTNLTSSK